MQANFWPTPTQTLLLTASLADRDAAHEAWQRWQAEITFENIDAGSRRLVPLLYWNLSRLKIDHPLMPKLRGCYRQTWFGNQRLLNVLESVLARFEREGIPTLVIKGIPLAINVYPLVGLRPMADLDIAVPHAFAWQACRMLEREGWTTISAYPNDRVLEGVPSLLFRAVDGTELDLHFSHFHECSDWKIYEEIWAAAEKLKIGRAITSSLCSADMLFHTLAHGARSNFVPPIRWIADAI